MVLKNDFVKNIFNRIKKLAILLVLLPILTGVIAYFLQSKTPVSYSGSAEIMLGNFEKEGLTHQELMRDQIPNRAFLTYLNEEHNLNMDVDFVSTNLSILDKPGKVLVFSMSGSEKAKIEEQLGLAIKGFIEESDRVQQEQIKLIEDKIADVEAIDASVEERISKERFIYDLSEKRNTMEMSTVLNKEVEVAPVNGNNPMERAILGLLVGIMINIVIIVFPELFREEK